MVARHFSFSNLAAELDKIASDQSVFETKSFAFACFVWGFSATNCQSLLQRYHLPIGRVTIAQECLEFFYLVAEERVLEWSRQRCDFHCNKIDSDPTTNHSRQETLLPDNLKALCPSKGIIVFLWYVVSVQASKFKNTSFVWLAKAKSNLCVS